METETFGWEFIATERLLPKEYWHTSLYYLLSYLVQDCYDQQEIAEFMGVDQATISRWRDKLRLIIGENDPKRLL